MSPLNFSEFSLLDALLLAPLIWMLIALVGLLLANKSYKIGKALFLLSALTSVFLSVAAFWAMDVEPLTSVLPLGLPNLPFHFRVDVLSAFFLLILGAASIGISVYASGYFCPKTSPETQQNSKNKTAFYLFFYHLFLASLSLVFLADDAYTFLIMWEIMAFSSYFLVASEHQKEDIRRASYLYLLIAHIGALCILISFTLMSGGNDFSFATMRQLSQTAALSPFAINSAFLLALIGFGAKAGLLPLHIWLPEAHPAAPSPVSALMSGIMLKTAAYGMIRIGFDLLHVQYRWWGMLLVVLGICAALFGVVFAAIQSDMKRLLAYSSIENMGLIFIGIGLALIFERSNMWTFAALALSAALCHCLNHAFFKSLLFLGTGSVLHATHERNLSKLGGLIHLMPWVAWICLIGALASAGLPPFNGFISEWLLLQSFLFTSAIPDSYLNMLLPVLAAAIVLVAALAGFTMVKFFGIIFLGNARDTNIAHAKDAGFLERAGLVWLAAFCVLLGVLPNLLIAKLMNLSQFLLGAELNQSDNWLFFAPIRAERASYSPLVFLIALMVLTPLAWFLIRQIFKQKEKRVPAWDCGFPLQTPQMQDSAIGFGQPIRRIFSPFMRRVREHPSPLDTHPRYVSQAEDPFWQGLYLPVARFTEKMSQKLAFLNQGRIALYLAYSFVTLLILLVLIRG